MSLLKYRKFLRHYINIRPHLNVALNNPKYPFCVTPIASIPTPYSSEAIADFFSSSASALAISREPEAIRKSPRRLIESVRFVFRIETVAFIGPNGVRMCLSVGPNGFRLRIGDGYLVGYNGDVVKGDVNVCRICGVCAVAWWGCFIVNCRSRFRFSDVMEIINFSIVKFNFRI